MGEIAIIRDIQKDFTDMPIEEVVEEEIDMTKDPEELHYVSPKKRLLATTRREIASREASPDKLKDDLQTMVSRREEIVQSALMEENKDLEVNMGDLKAMFDRPEPKESEKKLSLPKLSESHSVNDVRPMTADFRTTRTLLPVKLPTQHSDKDLLRLDFM